MSDSQTIRDALSNGLERFVCLSVSLSVCLKSYEPYQSP